MKGWEIYKKDWGCGDLTYGDFIYAWEDGLKYNAICIDLIGAIFYTGAYIRQVIPVQVLVEERRLRCQIKLMQDQWRRGLYDPSRAICRKRIQAEFRDLSEQEDRIGCTDLVSKTL